MICSKLLLLQVEKKDYLMKYNVAWSRWFSRNVINLTTSNEQSHFKTNLLVNFDEEMLFSKNNYKFVFLGTFFLEPFLFLGTFFFKNATYLHFLPVCFQYFIFRVIVRVVIESFY